MARRNAILLGIIIIIYCSITQYIYGSASFVYNFRIAETTKKILEEEKHIFEATITPIGQFRKKYNGDIRNFGGAMGTGIYSYMHHYFRVDFAVARVVDKYQGVHFARTQFDDILFYGGYTHKVHQQVKMTFSGLFGIPTHQDTSLSFPQFGIGHVGTGLQVDSSIMVSSDNRKHSLQPSIRAIHFFQRKVKIEGEPGCFEFTAGNLIDLFIAYHQNRPEAVFETGYDLGIWCGAQIKPFYDDVVNKTNYIRHSFYGSYKWKFSIREHQSSFLTALSYGFESGPKKYGYKSIFILWGAWQFRF